MSEQNPEVGKSIKTGNYQSNYHDRGTGETVIMLHGSGAGVSGWANWRGQVPVFSERFRVVVPDLIGFGFTERRPDQEYKFMDSWSDQIINLMDALKIEKAHFIGNSFGGSVTLAVAVKAPQRVGRFVLMGSGGVKSDMTDELEILWGYTPSVANMKRMMQVMAYDQSLVTDELAEMRYKASMRPGVQETFAKLFPPPRQRWLDVACEPEEKLRALPHQALIIHGRDDRVVRPSASLKLHELLQNSQLHMFGRCGHWTMIEHRDRFNRLVMDFFSEK
jgi:2-hydroxymuconate-semialdehyde hydrolase